MSGSSSTAMPEPTDADGAALAEYAARVVLHRLRGAAPPASDRLRDVGALRERRASFVTLERGGVLRGCVGSLDARLPLYRDVARNAVRAMTDPRLSPLRSDEWPDLTVTVSVLSPPDRVAATGFDELAAVLRPGVDGLIIAAGGRRATFLPSVWARLGQPARFLDELLAKGGWPAGRLPADAVVHRYTARHYRHRAE